MAKRVPDAPTDKPPKKRAPRQQPTTELAPDDLQAIFGQNVRTARLKLGMTQQQVAEATGMAFSYVGKVENGEKNVTLDTMRKLAAVLDLDLGQLFRQAPSQKVPSSKNG